jgi:flavin reductase (DIM6/NTAB) family NADH-FMN oxidoreductase RutF
LGKRLKPGSSLTCLGCLGLKIDVMDDFYKLLHPCMTVLVASVSRDGRPNVMTCAWNMPVSDEPPMIAIALGSESYTSQLIKESGEFTVNIPDERLIKAVWICGTRSGRSVDKFKLAGLTPRPAKKVKAPIVDECVGASRVQAQFTTRGGRVHNLRRRGLGGIL